MTRTSVNTDQNTFRKKVTNIHKYFKEYCASTSIHGFQYFGQDRSVFEKIWWTIIFILCLCGCSAMIYKIYDKYDSSPVIVTFATVETPIYQIPFPAVTICPQIKSDKWKFNLTEILEKQVDKKNLTDKEFQYLQYMSLVCENQKLKSNCTFDEGSFNEVFNALDEIKPQFTVLECKLMGNNCDNDFTPVFTDEGVCYSLNILDRGHIFKDWVYRHKDYHKVLKSKDTPSWDMEKGYFEKSKLTVYPARALFSGATNGLTVNFVTSSEDVDYSCNTFQGFKVVLHSPVRIPRLKQEYFRMSLDEAVVAAVQPAMVTTSEAVKKYEVEKRDCYFPSERELRYFKSYSQQNCLLECLTNVTLDTCQCVNSFMPRNSSTSICGIKDQTCLKHAELLQLEELRQLSDWNLGDCSCLPLCTDLSYNVQTSQTHWDWEKTAKSLEIPFDQNFMHLSKLTVYFKVNHFIASERQELYGPTDFVANFGGLLGLFTGFSILSLMEIIYFLTVRICCNIRLYGRWMGNNDN